MSTDTATATTETPGSASETGTTTDQQTSTQPAATSAAASSTTEGAAAADTPWQDSLAEGLRENPLFRNFKTVDELARAHDHLTKLKGAPANQLLKLPAKGPTEAPDDWAPVLKAMGVPETGEGYKIELAPEAAADTPELAKVLQDLGVKGKLTQGAMNVVVETLNGLGKQAAEAEQAQLAAQTKEVSETLAKEWGAAAEGNRRAIGKLIRDALGGQVDDAALADLETSLGSNLTLSRVLAHAVGKMAEPEAPEGGGNAGAGGQRPMSPAAATAALQTFYADDGKAKALREKNHPQHKAVLAERAQLLAWQRGDQNRPDAVS